MTFYVSAPPCELWWSSFISYNIALIDTIHVYAYPFEVLSVVSLFINYCEIDVLLYTNMFGENQ